MSSFEHDLNPTGRGFRVPLPCSGLYFYPEDPRPEEFNIVDIAHKLAMQCRYGGGVTRFYSVAEHCVLLARYAYTIGGKSFAREALLHDRAEAYVPDMMRPIKEKYTGDWFYPLERRIESVSAPVFRVPAIMSDEVRELDYRICIDEKAQAYHRNTAMDKDNAVEKEKEPLGIQLKFWSPSRAKHKFLKEWERLV